MQGHFYSELLTFLRGEVEKRLEEGFDPKLDPQLRALLKGLEPSSGDEPIPLDEIIDNYQHLFNSRGPIHLEKILMEAFPLQEFRKLGVMRTFPRMYRGLPRLYHRDQPSQSHVKKPFTHLPSLKKQALAKALYSLYHNYPASGKMTLFTWVINDGFGDYIAAVEVMRLLKGRLANVEVHFVGLIHEKMIEGLKSFENAIIIPYKDDCDVNLITEEAIELLRSSDLILQIPTYYPHFDALMDKVGSERPKVEMVGEYGFLESNWFHPKTDRFSMGLHFLEKGVLVRRPIEANWDDLENEELKKYRHPENHFYLAYLTSPVGGAIYLHALLKSLEFDAKGIDLCIPELSWFFRFIERQEKASRPILEWELGIESIEIYYRGECHCLQIASQGKKLRFLCPQKISQSDFRVLLSLSGDWVGVRGDQSFSEVISQGKAFFYDGREHARYFIKDLLALAENRVGDYPGCLECIRGMSSAFLYNLPVQDNEWVDETFFQEVEEWTAIALKIGLSLQDKEAVLGFQKLCKIIVEERSVNSFLSHLVQRAICHQKNPEFEKIERENVERFASNRQTFSETIQKILSYGGSLLQNG